MDFDAILCSYCASTGEPWTDELEDRLTFPRLEAYQKYWKQFPPTHVLVRQIAIALEAYKPPPEDRPQGTLDDLRSIFPAGKI